VEFSVDFFLAPLLNRVDIKAEECNGMSSPLRSRRRLLALRGRVALGAE
jgi:hypothetical protein